MIKLLVNHEYAYDTANIVRLFCGKEQLDMIDLRALEDFPLIIIFTCGSRDIHESND